MKAIGKILGRLIVGCVFACCLTATPQLQAQTYYLRTQSEIPYPSDPYHGALPMITLNAAQRIFQIQDTPKDFEALGGMNNPNILNAASTNSPSVNSFTSSGFNLNIAMDDDNSTKIVYFDTSPGSLYRIETSTNLIDWLRSRHL